MNIRGEIHEKKNKKNSCMDNAFVNGWQHICYFNWIYALRSIKPNNLGFFLVSFSFLLYNNKE